MSINKNDKEEFILNQAEYSHLYRWWDECYLFTINASFLVKA